MSEAIKLGFGVKLGGNNPSVIILDAGVNHNNDVARAKELIRTAKEGGADIIKFQTYSADEITTKKAPRYWNPKLDTDGGGSQYDMFKKVDGLPKSAYYELKEYAKELKIIFSSSPFGMESAKFLKKLDVDVYKVASAEMTNHEMIKFIADIGKPVILSTGACSIGEIEEVLDIIFKAGNKQLALQHCILSYPCRDEDANLIKMVRLQQLFPEIPVGFSDHTYGTVIPLAAVALGAKSIEKHYTIDKNLPDSPDHKFSLTKDELSNFVTDCRRIENSLGKYKDAYYPAEKKAYLYARKSIVAEKPIKKGMVITKDIISCKRPGTGISPKFMSLVIGRKAKVNIDEDEIIRWDMV
jgi:sialic acid synthase SpsE